MRLTEEQARALGYCEPCEAFHAAGPCRATDQTPRKAAPDEETEDHFQARVVAVAKANGWLVYHTHDSRKSAAGWPDLSMVHETTGRLLLWELKRESKSPTPPQVLWLRALGLRHEASVKRPSDWAEVVAMLTGEE